MRRAAPPARGDTVISTPTQPLARHALLRQYSGSHLGHLDSVHCKLDELGLPPGSGTSNASGAGRSSRRPSRLPPGRRPVRTDRFILPHCFILPFAPSQDGPRASALRPAFPRAAMHAIQAYHLKSVTLRVRWMHTSQKYGTLFQRPLRRSSTIRKTEAPLKDITRRDLTPSFSKRTAYRPVEYQT